MKTFLKMFTGTVGVVLGIGGTLIVLVLLTCGSIIWINSKAIDYAEKLESFQESYGESVDEPDDFLPD